MNCVKNHVKINYMWYKPQIDHLNKNKLKYKELWKNITSGNKNVKKQTHAKNK